MPVGRYLPLCLRRAALAFSRSNAGQWRGNPSPAFGAASIDVGSGNRLGIGVIGYGAHYESGRAFSEVNIVVDESHKEDLLNPGERDWDGCHAMMAHTRADGIEPRQSYGVWWNWCVRNVPVVAKSIPNPTKTSGGSPVIVHIDLKSRSKVGRCPHRKRRCVAASFAILRR